MITTPNDYYSLNDPSDLLVAFGSNCLDTPRAVYLAAALIRHPDFNENMNANDISLIRLSQDIEFNENIQPIDLPTADYNYDGYSLIVTGWGRLWVNLSNISINFNKYNFGCKSYKDNVDYLF